jgi:hypothetical protein
MIKITKLTFHFILKVVMVAIAACIGLYAGFAKSGAELSIKDSHAFPYFSSPTKTLVCKCPRTRDIKHNT